MDIILENIHTQDISISDLGTILKSNESLNMLENYTRDEILGSNDLEVEYENGYIQFTMDNNNLSLIQVIKAITGMTTIEHENLDTLKHGLSESSFFQVERNEDDDVEKIVYYKDGTLTTKIREDEIVRNEDEDVVQIIKRQYDIDGNIIVTETQTINRVNGDVVSIETEAV